MTSQHATYIGTGSRRISATAVGLGVCIVSAAMLVGALAFQYIGGLDPCPLCHLQRYPYIAALILGAASIWVSGGMRAPLLVLAALAFWTTAGIGFYHAGVEYGFWPGPDTCSGAAELSVDMLQDFSTGQIEVPTVSCSDAAWTLMGISMAGYNFLIAGFVGLVTLVAALRTRSAR